VIPRKPENSRGVRRKKLGVQVSGDEIYPCVQVESVYDETKLEILFICYSYSLSPTCNSERMIYVTYIHIGFC